MLTLPDKKCVDLATHFLPDDEGDRIWSLALAFQEVVEDFFQTPNDEHERNVQAAFDSDLCSECGKEKRDTPSKLCPGCQAYREHQQ